MIKAIETVYNGYRFRSRLEARWAVFFDSLGIPYEYEKEGYDLDGLRYLPDFWLPEQKCWVEIKAEQPQAGSDEQKKATLLVQYTGFPLALLYGQVNTQLPDIYYQDKATKEVQVAEGCLLECPFCHAFAFVRDLDLSQMPCVCWGFFVSNMSFAAATTPQITASRESAQQARFEHGEMPHIERGFSSWFEDAVKGYMQDI